jgi:hypothetical protein
LGEPAWVDWFGGAGILPQLASTVRNDSHLLSCQPGKTDTPILLYFRHTPSGYSLYVREPGNHFGKRVCLFGDYLGLGTAATQPPCLLTLESDTGAPFGLADLSTDRHVIRLALDGQYVAPVTRRGAPHLYLSFKKETTCCWMLKILERNVPWLSTPDER